MASTAAEARSAPEGARGWISVAVAFLSMSVVFGVAYSFGAFFAPMAAEFGSGSGATSVVFSVTISCSFVLGSVSGRAVDRFGPRPVLLVGAAALAAGLLLTSIVEQLWVGYLTYGLGVGIAVACGYVPMVAVVGAWFDSRRALALGIAIAGIGIGTLIGSPIAAALIEARGWRQTHVVFGIVGAALLVVCAVVVRRPPMPEGEPAPAIRELVRTTGFRSMYAATFLGALALFVPFVYLPSYAMRVGVSPVAAATLVGVIGVASVLSRLAIGVVADRIGRIRTFRASFATVGLSFAIWLVAGSFPALVAFAVVLGVGYGGWIALQPTVLAEMYGVRGLGGIVGLVYTAAGVGALIGAPLAGVLIDATGTFAPAIAAAGVCALAAFAALLRLP